MNCSSYRNEKPYLHASDVIGFHYNPSLFCSEWNDGLLPHILRKYCAKTPTSHLQSENKASIKVVLLDGECDPTQMEIMGSILHNDGTIVLGNNERIPMSGHVRFIWEVRS